MSRLSVDVELILLIKVSGVNLAERVMDFVAKCIENNDFGEITLTEQYVPIINEKDSYIEVEVPKYWYKVSFPKCYKRLRECGILVRIPSNIPFHSFPQMFPHFCREALGVELSELKLDTWNKKETVRVLREIIELFSKMK